MRSGECSFLQTGCPSVTGWPSVISTWWPLEKQPQTKKTQNSRVGVMMGSHLHSPSFHSWTGYLPQTGLWISWAGIISLKSCYYMAQSYVYNNGNHQIVIRPCMGSYDLYIQYQFTALVMQTLVTWNFEQTVLFVMFALLLSGWRIWKFWEFERSLTTWSLKCFRMWTNIDINPDRDRLDECVEV